MKTSISFSGGINTSIFSTKEVKSKFFNPVELFSKSNILPIVKELRPEWTEKKICDEVISKFGESLIF